MASVLCMIGPVPHPMAGKVVFSKLSPQEMAPASTSMIASPDASFQYICRSNSSRWRHGLHDVSLCWGSAFVSCGLSNSRAQKTLRKRKSATVAEWMEPSERDKKSYGVETFPTRSESAAEETTKSTKEEQFWTWNLMKLVDRIADHADRQTEIGVKKRRAFYKAEDWIQHRSSKRHLRHILSTFSSRVIISLIPPVSALTFMAAVVASYNTLVDAHLLPSFLPLLHISSLPHQLTAPALALLLVFRTEASYSRYDESRKTWTKVFACTKDFSRQCLAWIQHPRDIHRRKDLQHYIMAFPVALKCHVLDGSDLRADLKSLLDEGDLAVVMGSQHRPNCLIQLMTQSMGLVQISDNQKSLMDANITQFNESVSVCERIMRSPIPLSYTRLTSRALILWHLTLPVVLWDDCQWLVVFATFFSSCTLFCIEEVGVLIEEPFPMLSLDKMCAAAHQSVEEFVELQIVTDEYLKQKEKKLRIAGVSGVSNGVSNGVSTTPV